MKNAAILPVPEAVQRLVDTVIEEHTASGTPVEQIFSDERIGQVVTEAMQRTGVSLDVPRTRRAAERFVCVALSNYALDHHVRY
jgi:hypothetical protein